MLSRSLSTCSGSLRLSATLTTRLSSHSFSTLRLVQPARCAVPSCASLRRFSAAPALRTEKGGNLRTPSAPSGSCFIANIPYKVTAEELQEAFSEFGTVESVKLLTSDGGLSRGIGFVHFKSVAGAVDLIEAHKADPIFLLDRQIQIEHAQKTKSGSLFVQPCDTLMVFNFQGESEAEVRTMFGNYTDDILAVRFLEREADRPSRKAFIQFRNVSMATEAMDAFKNQNADIQIAYAKQRQPSVKSNSLTSRLSQHRGY